MRDMDIKDMEKKLNKEISLKIEEELFDKLDYSKAYQIFNVIDETDLTEVLKITSSLNPNDIRERELNYVELILEFKLPDKSVLQWPFRLSSYNTIPSEISIPFVKYSPDYQIIVSGRAIYENGERNCIPFISKNQIINLDESMF